MQHSLVDLLARASLGVSLVFACTVDSGDSGFTASGSATATGMGTTTDPSTGTDGGSTSGGTSGGETSGSTGGVASATDGGSTGGGSTGGATDAGSTSGVTAGSTGGGSTGGGSTGGGSTGGATTGGAVDAPVGTVVCGPGGYTPSTYVSPTPDAPELHIMGVYEGTNATIPVNLDRPGSTITLVLSSYESVTWELTVVAGTTLDTVYVDGYNASTVTGQGGATVNNQSGGGQWGSCAYEWQGGCATGSVVSGAESATGLTLDSFTGCYSGTSFTLK